MKDKLRYLIQTYIEAKDRDVHDINKFMEEIDKLYRGSLIHIIRRIENKELMISAMRKATQDTQVSQPQYERIWDAIKSYTLEGK